MDILGAKKNVDKLLKYVQGVASTDVKLYTKSRDKLKDVAVTCNEVVKIISEILQEEILETDSAEFQSDTNISGVIDSMQLQINQLKKFAGIDQVDVAEETVSRSSGLKDNRSPAAKKQIFQEYRTCLSQLSEVKFEYDEISQCANLIWRWFDVRFIQTSQQSEFKYQMKKFPLWIRDIVILYGHALQSHRLNEFIQSFNNWINTLVTSDTYNSYSVPYEIYKFDRYHDKEKVNLDSVIIWDVLVSSGLNALCKRSDPYYMSEDSVYELTGELNPTALNNYLDFRDHPEIFDVLCWRKEDNKIA